MIEFNDLKYGQKVKMGETIGRLILKK